MDRFADALLVGPLGDLLPRLCGVAGAIPEP
jgi:hypothetical protein